MSFVELRPTSLQLSQRGKVRERHPITRPGLDLLAGVPLFKGLSRRHLKKIAAAAQEVEHDPGVLFFKDDPASTMYVIVEGKARVYPGFTQSGRPLARMGPGDFFGELAVLGGGKRTATVVAETPLVAVRIDRTPLLKLLRGQPDLAVRILQGMAVRMQGLVKRRVD